MQSITPGGPEAEAAEFSEVEVEVPPGVPLANAEGPLPGGDALHALVTLKRRPELQALGWGLVR